MTIQPLGRKVTIIQLTHEQIANALAHIQRGIDAGANGTATDLTAKGILTHVLIDLDLGVKVVPE